jgi:solute carrier family 50 protein (sugar transporter)
MEVFDMVVPPLATAAAIGTYAGSLLDARSWKEQGTGSLSHLPYGMLLLNAGGWVCYGVLSGIASIVISNVVGLTIAAGLCAAFVAFSREGSSEAQTMYGYVAGYLVLLSLLSFYGALTAETVGLLSSAVSILMFASPLATLRTVLSTKSAASLPAPMVVVGLACTVLWTAYGVRQGNPYMYVPNGIAVLLGLSQVALLIVFRERRPILPV